MLSRLQKLKKTAWLIHAAGADTDVGMLGKMCRVPLVCVPCLPVFLLVCMLCRPVYAGHPYIHLISFEIFLLALS